MCNLIYLERWTMWLIVYNEVRLNWWCQECVKYKWNECRSCRNACYSLRWVENTCDATRICACPHLGWVWECLIWGRGSRWWTTWFIYLFIYLFIFILYIFLNPSRPGVCPGGQATLHRTGWAVCYCTAKNFIFWIDFNIVILYRI